MGKQSKKIAIIDYGAGNLGSVVNALQRFGYNPSVTGNASEVLMADAVFFPGDGAAGATMQSLEKSGLAAAIKELVKKRRPLFAICVGLQVLLSASEEGGEYGCLDIIKGRVRKLPPGLKIPHMGWNQVKQQFRHAFFTDIPDNANFYFVHSYYADPCDGLVVAGLTDYGLSFCSVIISDNLFATQFHPEKSGEPGLQMYSNFLKIACV
ncbi:MAG: imidazole glycerol phosphate synthase subunit HisH [Dehalococcoidia bacterium]|nr:imidazole glycerol phosphate synthase subunit HisH [Dehalococcoidia bacterium]